LEESFAWGFSANQKAKSTTMILPFLWPIVPNIPLAPGSPCVELFITKCSMPERRKVIIILFYSLFMLPYHETRISLLASMAKMSVNKVVTTRLSYVAATKRLLAEL